jgi:hypothetical protein
MVKYLARSCPRCRGYLGIVLRKPGRNIALQAINGHCLECGYRLAWILVRGRRVAGSVLLVVHHAKMQSVIILVFTALASSFLVAQPI